MAGLRRLRCRRLVRGLPAAYSYSFQQPHPSRRKGDDHQQGDRQGVAARVVQAGVNTTDSTASGVIRIAVSSTSYEVNAVHVQDGDNVETEPSALRILEACVLDHEADGSGCVVDPHRQASWARPGSLPLAFHPSMSTSVAERLVDAGVSHILL